MGERGDDGFEVSFAKKNLGICSFAGLFVVVVVVVVVVVFVFCFFVLGLD